MPLAEQDSRGLGDGVVEGVDAASGQRGNIDRPARAHRAVTISRTGGGVAVAEVRVLE